MDRANHSNTDIRYILFLLVFLASQTFFNPLGFISEQMGKFFFYSLSLLAVVYAYFYGVNIKRVNYSKRAYQLVILGIIFSIVMVQSFQNQSLSITVIATLPYIFGYLFYYTLMKFNIPLKSFERTFKWLTIISAIIYLANLFAFPNRIFGEEKEEVDMTRGFMRLGVSMIVIVVTYFFYCINRWLIDGKAKWLWWIALTAVLIVMSLTRQVIVVSFLLGVFFFMKNTAMWRRIVVVLLGLVFYLVVVSQISIFNTMFQLSENQYEMNRRGDENIRITAWRFYTTEYQTNTLTYFFGNGVPSQGRSPWGINDEFTVYPRLGGNGCLRVDVGWAGFYWYFGAFATLGLFLLMFKAVRRKKKPNQEYLTYALIFIMLTAVASGPVLFYKQIIEVCMLLYLVFSKQNNNYALHRHSNTQLQ